MEKHKTFWPPLRFWNIACRTAHLAVSGALFGGHVFGVEPNRLLPFLCLTLFTGAVLSVLEAYPKFIWFVEARGICVIVKMVLIVCVPWLWNYRVLILAVVIVIGSVGSHMPRHLRHFVAMPRRPAEPGQGTERA